MAGVTSELVGGVARMAIARAEKRNAIDPTVARELVAGLAQADADPACRVIVLAGDGRSLSAGADLCSMRDAGGGPEEDNLDGARVLAGLFATIDTVTKPVVCRVHGPVRGGGGGLVAAADLAIMAADSTIAFSEVRLGLVAAAISPYVVRRVGPMRARGLFLSARTIGAETALAYGLVDIVVPPAELDEAVEHVVAELLRGGPQAQREIKSVVARLDRDGGEDPDERFEWTVELIARIRAGAEAQAGITAFLARTNPPWE